MYQISLAIGRVFACYTQQMDILPGHEDDGSTEYQILTAADISQVMGLTLSDISTITRTPAELVETWEFSDKAVSTRVEYLDLEALAFFAETLVNNVRAESLHSTFSETSVPALGNMTYRDTLLQGANTITEIHNVLRQGLWLPLLA